LRDSKEQRRRFVQTNQERVTLSKEPMPLDEDFLDIVDKLPSCSGIAIGLERLFMAIHKIDDIADLIAFDV